MNDQLTVPNYVLNFRHYEEELKIASESLNGDNFWTNFQNKIELQIYLMKLKTVSTPIS